MRGSSLDPRRDQDLNTLFSLLRGLSLKSSHKRGSTGSLSSARTPNTHSCVRRSGSFLTNRSSASIPRANSRLASDRFAPTPRERGFTKSPRPGTPNCLGWMADIYCGHYYRVQVGHRVGEAAAYFAAWSPTSKEVRAWLLTNDALRHTRASSRGWSRPEKGKCTFLGVWCRESQYGGLYESRFGSRTDG